MNKLKKNWWYLEEFLWPNELCWDLDHYCTSKLGGKATYCGSYNSFAPPIKKFCILDLNVPSGTQVPNSNSKVPSKLEWKDHSGEEESHFRRSNCRISANSSTCSWRQEEECVSFYYVPLPPVTRVDLERYRRKFVHWRISKLTTNRVQRNDNKTANPILQ